MQDMFLDTELEVIEEYLSKKVSSGGRVSSDEAYTALHAEVGLDIKKQAAWKKALSTAINDGKLPKFRITRGRGGGIRLANDAPKKRAFTKPEEPKKDEGQAPECAAEGPEQKETSPKKVSYLSPIKQRFVFPRHVWINRKEYLVNQSFAKLDVLMFDVFLAKPSDDGNLVYNGKKYQCENASLLERILVKFLLSDEAGESEPVLQGEDGVPVELKFERQ